MKLYICPLLLLTILVNCSSESKGPTAAERREAMNQKYVDQLATEQNTLHVTDSLIQAIIPRINEVTSTTFDYIKTEYDDLGRFVPKGMSSDDNVQRTYIHCAVDEYGQTQLISSYCGSKLEHTQLRITASDGTSATTDAIPYNDRSNYRYTIDGSYYESVTYISGRKTGSDQVNKDTDGGVFSFIALHAEDSKLYGTLLGGKKEVRVAISAKERMGLVACFELGVLLRDKLRLEQENKTAAGKIRYLQEVIAKKEISHSTNDNS